MMRFFDEFSLDFRNFFKIDLYRFEIGKLIFSGGTFLDLHKLINKKISCQVESRVLKSIEEDSAPIKIFLYIVILSYCPLLYANFERFCDVFKEECGIGIRFFNGQIVTVKEYMELMDFFLLLDVAQKDIIDFRFGNKTFDYLKHLTFDGYVCRRLVKNQAKNELMMEIFGANNQIDSRKLEEYLLSHDVGMTIDIDSISFEMNYFCKQEDMYNLIEMLQKTGVKNVR